MLKIHHKNAQIHTLYATIGKQDFCNIGKYTATSPNIEAEIFALIRGLSPENQAFVLRQIAIAREAYEKNNPTITELLPSEIQALAQIQHEFLPKILRLNDKLYYYGGYFLPQNHFETGVFYYKHSLDILEPRTLEMMKNRDFIDVGGFIGDSAIIFEREFTSKKIYTFEATRVNFELLKETLRLNNSKRIVPINLGLGAKKSTMNINVCSSGSSMAFDFYSTGEVECAELTTLDDFVRENSLGNIGFIKVDIEGFEMQFLQGAKETICAQRPAMLISIYHQGSDYFGIKPLIESWNLGYSFKIHKGTDGHLTGETALFCEILG